MIIQATASQEQQNMLLLLWTNNRSTAKCKHFLLLEYYSPGKLETTSIKAECIDLVSIIVLCYASSELFIVWK